MSPDQITVKDRGVKVSGMKSSEDIFFSADEDKFVKQMPLLMANYLEGSGESRVDGVIGLSRQEHSFVSYLFKRDVIKRNMFAMHFSNEVGKMWIGGYPKNYLQKQFP